MLAAMLLGLVLSTASVAPSASTTATPPPPPSPAAPVATPQFESFGVSDRLPRGAIYAEVQDHRGLMWFATVNGLIRYDGVDFHLFRKRADDPRSLPAESIYALHVGPDNRIWIGSVNSGLIVYDQQTKTFRRWVHQPNDPASLASNETWNIAQTPDGSIWVATEQGLDRMRADGRGFDHVALPGASAEPSFGSTRALLVDTAGRLWIGAQDGLYVRQTDGKINRVPVAPSFAGNIAKVWNIDGGNGQIRVATEGGLLRIDANGVAQPMYPQQLASRRVVSSTRDRRGRLWIGTADGLLLDPGDGQLQLIGGHPQQSGGLPGNKIWQTMLDRDGGLWIVFEESTLAYLPAEWDSFEHFSHVPDDPDSLTGIALSSLLVQANGKVLVGGENNWIDELDPASGQVRHLVTQAHGQVVSMAQDAQQQLWIAVAGGLQLFAHGRISDIDLSGSGISRPMLLASDHQHSIVVGTWSDGVFRVDARSHAITRIRLPASVVSPPMPSGLEFNPSDDRLWYASSAGLFRSSADGTQLEFVPGVPHGEIDNVAFDRSGFWVTTPAALVHYRFVAGRATSDRRVDARSTPFAPAGCSLRADQQDRLWLFCNPGLWMFDPDSGRFRSFGPAQGLRNAHFYSVTPQAMPDGSLVVPNVSSVIAFNPSRLLRAATPDQPPLLTLTRISVRRGGQTRTLFPDRVAIHLSWRDRDLDVQARVASYVDPAANHYRFRLQGFDSGWVDVDSRGERSFAGLAAGDYLLQVKAAGADGAWSATSAPLHVVVQAPPWARWWAWLAYVMAIVLIAGLVLRSWRHRLAQQHRMQLGDQQRHMVEAASAAKTQFLATLSHEIRTPMTGVMGMAELLLSTPLTPLQHDYTRAMQRSGSMLLKLLNDALDLARIEAGRLELEPVPFDPRQLVQDVAQLEQGLAHSKGIRFVLDVADNLPLQLVGDPVRIKQVLLNLATNALKFTEHGSVTLRAQRSPSGLLLSVIDTGPGIPEASQARLFQRFEQGDGPQRRAGSGLGLAICRELVEMMGGSVELESRVGHGSTFRVQLTLPEPDTVASARDAVAAGKLRLLLVEDDIIVAAVIRGLLEQQHHVVCHVANGLAALAELAHADFDAVLLDLDLPGVDGFQIARLIRQREHAEQHLPIVAVTARSGSDDEAKARAAGMDGFLRKPLSGEDLAQALAQLMDPVMPAAAPPTPH